MSKKIKDAYIQRYKLLEEQLPKLIDKYSVVKRLYIAGIAINAYLIYRNVVWLSVSSKHLECFAMPRTTWTRGRTSS